MKTNLQIFIYALIIFLSSSYFAQSISWTETRPAGDEYKIWHASAINSDGSKLIVGDNNGRLYISTNGGGNWTETQPAGNRTNNWRTVAISSDGTKMIAAADISFYGLYITTDGGENWAKPGFYVDNRPWRTTSISADGTTMLAGESGTGGRLFLTTDGGANWNEIKPGGLNMSWSSTAISSDGSVLLAGVNGGRLYISKTGGSIWGETQPIGNVDTNWTTTSMSADGSVLLAGTHGGKLYISTNGGTNWSETGTVGNWFSSAMSSDGQKIIAGQYPGRLYVSANGGTTWSETQPKDDYGSYWLTVSMSADATKLIAGEEGRLYINTNPLPVELTSFSATANENNVLLKWQTAAEVNNFGFEIERSTVTQNNISSPNWEKIGFVEGHGNSNSSKVYSFTDEPMISGTLRYRLKQIDFDGAFEYSSVVEVSLIDRPTEFSLDQNYPNPFNPATTISYSVPKSEFLTLKVYDVLGGEVATLVNEQKEAGIYSVNFDASKLASGLYFYSLNAGDFNFVKKMILVK